MASYGLEYSAGLLGVSKETLRRWIKEGRVKAHKGYKGKSVCKSSMTKKWSYGINEEEVNRVAINSGKIFMLKRKKTEIVKIRIIYLNLIEEHEKEIERLEREMDKQIREILSWE